MKLSDLQVRILRWLAFFEGLEGAPVLGREILAMVRADTGYGRRSFNRSLRRLEDRGLVDRIRRGSYKTRVMLTDVGRVTVTLL